VPGFCRAASIDEVREHNYALTPGRYVGSEDADDEDEPFEEKFPRLVEQLEEQFAESHRLERLIRKGLLTVDLSESSHAL
jgi:type I restriction enzyme M protein